MTDSDLTLTIFDPQDPAGRARGESLRANTAFRDYAMMGSGRSLRKLFERYKIDQTRSESGTESDGPPCVSLSTLTGWSAKFQWQNRCIAYERLLDQAEEQAWQRRRRELRGTEWELQGRLIDLANMILDSAPDFISSSEVRLPDGTRIIYQELNALLAIRAAELGSDLGRRAVGIEKQTLRVEHAGLPEAAALDLSGIDDAQLERVIQNLLAAGAESVA